MLSVFLPMDACQEASGKVPAAIHVTPEAVKGGAIGQLVDGDMVTIDAVTGVISTPSDLTTRPQYKAEETSTTGFGRELFASYRQRCIR